MRPDQLRQETARCEWLEELHSDCTKCSGLCCTALCFFKSDGFPTDKPAGKPCKNLLPDFRCAVHVDLLGRGLKGCAAYDCFGAGQRVTKEVYGGITWRDRPGGAQEVFAVFSVVRQLHQMLWYLIEASTLLPAQRLWPEADRLIEQVKKRLVRSPAQLRSLQVEEIRSPVNRLLKQVIGLVSAAYGQHELATKSVDLAGKNKKGSRFDGQDLSMSLLLAANLSECSFAGVSLLGADLRDANLKNADLSASIFLTQMQINTAKGNPGTKLPPSLSHPQGWL